MESYFYTFTSLGHSGNKQVKDLLKIGLISSGNAVSLLSF